MKLYPRKLNSVEELKREQLRLKIEKLHTKASDLMPIKELSRGRKSGSSGNILSLAMDMMNSRSNLQSAMLVAGPLLRLFRGNSRKKEYRREMSRPHKKSMLRAAVTEIVVGYLIGKSVQLGIRAVQLYVRSRKSKKQREREEEYERNMGW